MARQILLRRLKRLKAALTLPGETRSVAALGFDLGFASESHCSRAFKATFGVTPGQFRAEARHAHLSSDEGTRTGELMTWYRGLG